MDELFQQIELRIRALIQDRENLTQSHDQLRQSKRHIMRDKELLLAKHQKVVLQIENMIARLQSIEGCHE